MFRTPWNYRWGNWSLDTVVFLRFHSKFMPEISFWFPRGQEQSRDSLFLPVPSIVFCIQGVFNDFSFCCLLHSPRNHHSTWYQRIKARWICKALDEVKSILTFALKYYDRNSATFQHVTTGDTENKGQWSTVLISVLGGIKGRKFLLS